MSMARVKKLLFVDTNIWLDPYRSRTEAGLLLLEHLEKIANKIIVTSQLEMEFKKNRRNAMVEGLQDLKLGQSLAQPGVFSNTKEVKAIRSSQKMAESRVKKLKVRYMKALAEPAVHDPVYKICQRIFHKTDAAIRGHVFVYGAVTIVVFLVAELLTIARSNAAVFATVAL